MRSAPRSQSFGGFGDGSVLRATIDAYLALVEEETELYRFLVQQDARPAPRSTSAFVVEVNDRIAVLLDVALRSAGRDPTPAGLWAVGIVGMVHAAGNWWAERRTAMSRATVVDALTSLILDGLNGAAADPAGR